jgi:uncharacterized YccA/Bax inhibitor family protein
VAITIPPFREQSALVSLTVAISVGLFMLGVFAFEQFRVGASVFGTHDFLDSEIVYLPLSALLSTIAVSKHNREVKVVTTTLLSIVLVALLATVFRLNQGQQILYLFAAMPIALVFSLILRLYASWAHRGTA